MPVHHRPRSESFPQCYLPLESTLFCCLLSQVMNDIDSHGKGILDFQRASTDKQGQRQLVAIPHLRHTNRCKPSASVKLRLREIDGQVGSAAFHGFWVKFVALRVEVLSLRHDRLFRVRLRGLTGR